MKMLFHIILRIGKGYRKMLQKLNSSFFIFSENCVGLTYNVKNINALQNLTSGGSWRFTAIS